MNLVSDISITLLSFLFFFSTFSVVILLHLSSLILYIGFLFYLWHRINENYFYSLEKSLFVKMMGAISAVLGGLSGWNIRIILFKHYLALKLHWVLFLFGFMVINFHELEFIFISLYSRRTLSISSFLLDNDYEYYVALLVSVVEFIFESYFFPIFKLFLVDQLFIFGFLIAVSGEFVRKLAICHAGESFSQEIENVHQSDQHILITKGIYSYCRHPSYIGWSMYVLGMQLMQANLFCLIMFSYVVYMFFKDRIDYEENLLYNFFGEKYLTYIEQVPLGYPFFESELQTKCNRQQHRLTKSHLKTADHPSNRSSATDQFRALKKSLPSAHHSQVEDKFFTPQPNHSSTKNKRQAALKNLSMSYTKSNDNLSNNLMKTLKNKTKLKNNISTPLANPLHKNKYELDADFYTPLANRLYKNEYELDADFYTPLQSASIINKPGDNFYTPLLQNPSFKDQSRIDQKSDLFLQTPLFESEFKLNEVDTVSQNSPCVVKSEAKNDNLSSEFKNQPQITNNLDSSLQQIPLFDDKPVPKDCFYTPDVNSKLSKKPSNSAYYHSN